MLRTAQRVRIYARLVDSKDGQQVWATRFDGDMTDLLALQDQVTSRISNSLQVALPAVCLRKDQSQGTPQVSELLMRGRMALNDERRRSINPHKQAEGYFRDALALEPDNSAVLTSLALVIAENLFNSRRLAQPGDTAAAQADAARQEANDLLQRATRLMPCLLYTSDAADE